MAQDNHDGGMDRRNVLKTIGAASVGLASITTMSGIASAKNPLHTHPICEDTGQFGGCAPDSGPAVRKALNSLNSTYNGGHDYRAGIGVEGRYYGSFTNENRENGVWFHDFVMSGFTTARTRGPYEDSWNLDQAIDSQTAIVANNAPANTGIVCSIRDGTTEWIGETHRNSEESSNEYTDAMKIALETLIGSVSTEVGFALSASDFIGALTNNAGDTPQSETWEIPWDYGSWSGGYASDCGYAVRFAVTSPSLGDEVDITTKHQSNIPTVNSGNPSGPYPHASLRWVKETTRPDGNSLSASDLSTYPSTTVSKSELPPYEGLHEMSEQGPIKRVMLPFNVTSSVSPS